ncbi:hypothetical protein SAMN06265337_0626 [Hymenobacter gelipurpurascens]|uniref:Uncharacterized protein n=1 Tax=Hymenobacter gelipurpurascens TaxID=89968 RepID=A0A212T857_9BACT|nr:hypothetical protein [Hymenobacter gelipurpurascens]SNC62218.1 hypothetical protein SAMN06265337_0626 [Hymenobacter gelipurpurascens]
MAYIPFKKVYTQHHTEFDPADDRVYTVYYSIETWDFDTVKRNVLYRDSFSNGFYTVDLGQERPPDESVEGEIYHECIGTTRRAYIHDGQGGFYSEDTLNSTECGFGAMVLKRLTPFAPAPGQATGRVQIEITGGTRPATVFLTNAITPQPVAVDANGWVEITGIPPGSYTALIKDSSTPQQQISQDFTISATLQGGCTDKAALNYNAGASFEDGSCQYTAPIRIPSFRAPLLNPLRFVAEAPVDGISVYQTPDNTLFCHESRPDQTVRPTYRQKVQRSDTHTLQVLTDYSGVTARVRRPATGAVVATLPFTLKQRYTGTADPVAVTLSEDASGVTRLTITAGPMPETLRRAVRVQLQGGASGTYVVRQTGLASDGSTYLLLSRPWTGAGANVQVRWELSVVPFNVWEVALNWATLAAGEYEVELRGTDATQPDAVLLSELVLLAEYHPNTVLLEYSNRDNAYGMVFTTGNISRLRVEGTFYKRKPSGTSSVHRSSSGTPTLLSSTAQRGILLETIALPDWLHEKLYLVLRLDGLRVNGQPMLCPGDYEWSQVQRYPLSGGTATLEPLQWLGAGNGDDAGSVLPPSSDNLLVLHPTGDFLKLH